METFLFSLKRYGDGMPTSPFHVKGMWMVAYIYVSYKQEIIYKWHVEVRRAETVMINLTGCEGLV